MEKNTLHTDIQTYDQHFHQHYGAGIKKVSKQFLFDGAIMKEDDGQNAGKVNKNKRHSIGEHPATTDNDGNVGKKNKQISF